MRLLETDRAELRTLPASLTDQLVVLANGAMASAGILGSPEPALHAKNAATVLLDAAATNPR